MWWTLWSIALAGEVNVLGLPMADEHGEILYTHDEDGWFAVHGDGYEEAIAAPPPDRAWATPTAVSGYRLLAPRTYDTGLHPQAAAIADVTGDGLDDVIVAYGSKFALFVQTPQHGLAAPQIDTAGASGSSAISTVDLDGDDVPEVTFLTTAGISVWRHTGGVLQYVSTLTLAPSPIRSRAWPCTIPASWPRPIPNPRRPQS